MPTRRSAYTARMYAMAAEEKYTKAEIIREMVILVPFGVGARETVRKREWRAAKDGYRTRPQGEYHTHSATIADHGQRQTASTAFLQHKRRGVIEVWPDGIVRLTEKGKRLA